MTKADIVRQVSKATGLTQPKALQAIDCMFSAITTSVADGHRVHFRNFGSFSSKKKSERLGRNPKTGEDVTITARTVPRFKASKRLRREVNV
jgi:DNA-binding protein HU-beta